MEKEKAEVIALQALAFVAKDKDLLEQFLTLSGATPHDLKSHFQESDFLGGILDMMLGNDRVLLDFCNSVSLSPESLVKAREILPGGQETRGS